MSEKKGIEADLASRALARVVDEQRDIEFLQLLIDRPIHRLAEMFFHAEGADRYAGQSKFPDRALGFFARRVDVLERHEPHGFQTGVFAAYAGDPIVVAAAK